MALTLTADEQGELERRLRSLKIRAEDARRARVILMLADGASYSAIETAVPCYRDYINRWRRRFVADRLEGLRARYRGQPPTVLTPAMEARVLEKTRQGAITEPRHEIRVRWCSGDVVLLAARGGLSDVVWSPRRQPRHSHIELRTAQS